MKRKSFTSTTQTRLYNRETSPPTTKMITTSNKFSNRTITNKQQQIINNLNKKDNNKLMNNNRFKSRINMSLFLTSMPLCRKNKLQGKSLSIKINSTRMITDTLATTSKLSTASTILINPNPINNNPIFTLNNPLNNTKSNSILKYSPISKDSKVSIDQYILYQQIKENYLHKLIDS